MCPFANFSDANVRELSTITLAADNYQVDPGMTTCSPSPAGGGSTAQRVRPEVAGPMAGSGGRGGVLGTAASTSARQRCHPTRRASRHSRCFASAFFVRKTAAGGRLLLPLQGRWGNLVAAVVLNSNLEFRTKNLMARACRPLTSGYDRPFRWTCPCDAAGATPHRNGRARVRKEHSNVT
jgi:hypothetical protein